MDLILVTMTLNDKAVLKSLNENGSAEVCYKDVIFQSSSPYRNAAELQKSYMAPFSVYAYTDGGTDH